MKLKNRTIYRVARDVHNPKPDRRRAAREIFSQPIMRVGTLLVCRDRHDLGLVLEPLGRGYWQTGSSDNYASETHNVELWRHLTTANILEVHEPRDADQALLAEDEGADATVVLDVLVKLGRTSLDEIRKAWRAAYKNDLDPIEAVEDPEFIPWGTRFEP